MINLKHELIISDHSYHSRRLSLQDGFTYERHGIQSALSHRWRSPMTGCDMGDTVP